MMTGFDRPISLALSGGGTRAMAYHLGVLKWMAEQGLFEKVARISTVSGGSLVMGLIYKSASFKWPTSKMFLESSLPNVIEILCSRSLQTEAMLKLACPKNLCFLLSRANLVAITLEDDWGFNIPISKIPSAPQWSINGTNAENGKRFRFKGSEIGDYDVGYAVAPNLPLAYALAVSAAFPVGIGPLTIRTSDFKWQRKPFGAPDSEIKVVSLPYERLHLYDGGLYDNLGSESLFDLGKQESKHAGDYVVVSDAGAPLSSGMVFGPISWQRVKRMMDIMSDQTRALRVRTLISYLKRSSQHGAYIPIGVELTGNDSLEAQFARSYPTSLKIMTKHDCERLIAHGYNVAANRSDFGFIR
mgnify:CR=1 FL=1